MNIFTLLSRSLFSIRSDVRLLSRQSSLNSFTGNSSSQFKLKRVGWDYIPNYSIDSSANNVGWTHAVFRNNSVGRDGRTKLRSWNYSLL